MRTIAASALALALVAVDLDGQQRRPASPEGTASTQVNGQWIDIVNGKPIPPGELVIVIDLKSDKDWTFVLAAQSYAKTYDPSNTKDLYGAYNYRPDNDVAPPPMTVKRLPYSVDQLMWWFSDITPTGGTCGLRGNG
jgi:hypothetical protein